MKSPAVDQPSNRASAISTSARTAHRRRSVVRDSLPRGYGLSGLMITMITALVMCQSLTGCALSRRFRERSQDRHAAARVLPPDMTAEELLAHVNKNASRVKSWESTDVSLAVKVPGMPRAMKLKSIMAVEAPRNFRLRAHSVFAAADFGSNDQRFWYWMRPGEPVIYTVRHEHAPMVQQHLDIPFEPEWLMEVLGVQPLSGTQFTLHPRDPEHRRVDLVSGYTAPDGSFFRRVVSVDMLRGRVIGHELFDSSSHCVAKATLDDYRQVSGCRLPHRIALDWPETKATMTITINQIDADSTLPSEIWQRPSIPGCQIVDLGEHVSEMYASRNPRAQHSSAQTAFLDQRQTRDGRTDVRPADRESPWDDTPQSMAKHGDTANVTPINRARNLSEDPHSGSPLNQRSQVIESPWPEDNDAAVNNRPQQTGGPRPFAKSAPAPATEHVLEQYGGRNPFE